MKIKGKISKTNIFIEKSKKIHGERYIYNSVCYEGAHSKVSITCQEHGDFLQSPTSHLNGSGCPKCNGCPRSNTSGFIKKAMNIHSNKYEYSKVEYKNWKTKIKIICKEHGEFLQRPNDHLTGNGCPLCAGNILSTTDEFVKKAQKIHGKKYCYTKVEYSCTHQKVKIICQKHGEFLQSPANHLRRNGCPNCCSSNGENEIENFLKLIKEPFVKQKTFNGCKHKFLLRFDFFLPSKNLVIEFDGIQHFKPIQRFGGEKGFNQVKIRDKIKDNYCKEHQIDILRIPYTKINKVKTAITEKINAQNNKV